MSCWGHNFGLGNYKTDCFYLRLMENCLYLFLLNTSLYCICFAVNYSAAIDEGSPWKLSGARDGFLALLLISY